MHIVGQECIPMIAWGDYAEERPTVERPLPSRCSRPASVRCWGIDRRNCRLNQRYELRLGGYSMRDVSFEGR